MARVRTEEKRRAILEAAATVFARHGYHPTTVAQIANELGISQMHVSRLLRVALDKMRVSMDLKETE